MMAMGKRERDRLTARYRVLKQMRESAQRLVDIANEAIEHEAYGLPREVSPTARYADVDYDVTQPVSIRIGQYNRLLVEHGLIAKAEG